MKHYNPLTIYSRQFIEEQIRQGFKYFVRQAHPLSLGDTRVKESLVITPYRDFDAACEHFNNIHKDKRKHIYDATDQDSLTMLKTAAAQPEGYLVYEAKFRGAYNGLISPFQDKIGIYINEHPQMRMLNDEDIQTDLSIVFGTVMVDFKFENQVHSVPLTVIDRL